MIFQSLKEKINPNKVASWYGKYERRISSFALIFGFVLDIATLRRVDMFAENLWIGGLLILAGVCIILIHKLENNAVDDAEEGKMHFWLNIVLQFSFGGILSAFLVFYFRSAELSSSWPFILILSVTFWANEFLRKHFARLAFQISLFFLLLFCCLIYIVPLLILKIGASAFLLAGGLSLAIMILYLHIFRYFTKEKFYDNRYIITSSILGIFIFINILYFANIIPPIPLSLKDSGVFYSIQKNPNGSYLATYEELGWRGDIQIYSPFRSRAGDAVFAYSAVFSPSDLDLNIVHEWEYFDEEKKDWVVHSRVPLPVVGGRDQGFRTYSYKNNLNPGLWRVNVETTQGQVIGRLRFEVIRTSVSPPLVSKILN